MCISVRSLLLGIAISMLTAPGAQATQCSDDIDNNSNGWIDLVDPYCKVADDNDESSFASGVPGDDNNAPHALDTWFDLDSGTGNDGCLIHACCMIDGSCPADLEPQLFDPGACTATQACVSFAQPLTKPGCDCFGCCEICTPGTSSCATVFVNPAVSPTCTLETIGDPAHCRACTQNPQCNVPSHIFRDGFEPMPVLLLPSLATLLPR